MRKMKHWGSEKDIGPLVKQAEMMIKDRRLSIEQVRHDLKCGFVVAGRVIDNLEYRQLIDSKRKWVA